MSTRYSVNNTYETHHSTTYVNALRHAKNMSRVYRNAPVTITWYRHRQVFRETFLWNTTTNDIAPYYGE